MKKGFEDRWMLKHRWLLTIAIIAGALLPTAARGQGETVALTVQLRTAGGEPVAGEPVELQRLPDEEVIQPPCSTDDTGRCTWQVGRGLYQVLFERPLDDVSALALAEGGLRGFGLTVGAEAITYHFTFHDDGHAYFDAAPEAGRPVPIIPTPELLHGGVAPTPTAEPAGEILAEAEPPATEGDGAGETLPEPAENVNSGLRWRLILFVGVGLVVGGGLHLWSRRKERATSAAVDREDTHA